MRGPPPGSRPALALLAAPGAAFGDVRAQSPDSLSDDAHQAISALADVITTRNSRRTSAVKLTMSHYATLRGLSVSADPDADARTHVAPPVVVRDSATREFTVTATEFLGGGTGRLFR